MNSTHSRYVKTADTVLDGSTLTDAQGDELRWGAVFAHSPITFELDSDSMLLDDGTTTLTSELISVDSGYYYFYGKKIVHKTGEATYYNHEPSH